ncbi:hypothetical protein [Halobacillus sp. BBL2006]|uniref:hypothetical protein n=1 Tax=Halobacillus sp. BBL2006 TaxID=1543706 RepID=UPI001E35B0EE|nr:hypothetical protein [Halobacillus sp. BBL2006]
MSKREWMTGLIAGIASGIGVHNLKKGSPVYKMKYDRKKTELYEGGKTNYKIFDSAKQSLKAEAQENTKLKGK